MSPPFTHSAHHCYADSIGAAGQTPSSLTPDIEKATAKLDAIRSALGKDSIYDCVAAALWRDDLSELERIAADYRARFDDVILIGIGGSALSARALAAIAKPGACRLHILANLQPGRLESLLGAIDPARTGMIAISKSGSTVEVMAQLVIVLANLAAKIGRDAVSKRVIAIAVPGDSALRRMAQTWRFPVLDHPVAVAGRYSVLTLVGMLPALILGLDVGEIRRGAATVLEQVTGTVAHASEGAALMTAFYRAGMPISVLLPYDERLSWFSRWYAQLWAESLGKSGMGMTPVTALGPIDQHSQLQLYLDGPVDKVFTVLVTDFEGQGLRVAADQIEGIDTLSYLRDRTIGDIVSASARATVETLVAHQRPVRVIALPTLNEEVMGGLFMHFILETILTADLWGVDPFDQPAVDEGKVRARDYLRHGRVAFET
ncbi:MAG: glucose-6-phosphate isomerase [Proteobacteria bacterium]|nr:glucose-6-phosphate isomerase [Pseudomonadota bacterium]MDA1058267.1 glucose-6-phosphate isomerase [Pseudomonadota bacterium]